MTMFEFAESHPWWTMVYLMIIANWVGGLIRIVAIHNHSRGAK